MYPFDATMEEREKFVENPKEFKLRCIDNRSYAYCYDWKGGFGIHLVDSRGGMRSKWIIEWGRNYRRNQHLTPDEWKGQYRYKFFIVFNNSTIGLFF